MNERVKKLSEEIGRLSPEQQAELLDEIVESLDESDGPKLDRALLDEIERRISLRSRHLASRARESGSR
jgi:hypothetical protein